MLPAPAKGLEGPEPPLWTETLPVGGEDLSPACTHTLYTNQRHPLKEAPSGSMFSHLKEAPPRLVTVQGWMISVLCAQTHTRHMEGSFLPLWHTQHRNSCKPIHRKQPRLRAPPGTRGQLNPKVPLKIMCNFHSFPLLSRGLRTEQTMGTSPENPQGV